MKTLFIGQNIIHLTTVNSTNSYASELLRHTKLPEGSLIYTFNQQNGRGQRNNVWESEPNKNVALSYVLYPVFLSADKQFLLTKIISLAVADLMSELLKNHSNIENIKIKWPNDIYVGDKKIAGILIENALRESMIQSAVVGIGVNINQTIFTSGLNATSLKRIANIEFDKMYCIERLCELIEARYLQLKANKLETLNLSYVQRLYRFDEWSDFISENTIFEGKIEGVSSYGKLQIQLKSAEVKEFDLKQIAFT